MFNKLQIRNFRKNERLDVDLEPITVFRGPSGKGKSSVVGSLKWLGFNSPSGTDFIHWDHNFAAVRLTEGKNSITRKRSKTENYYKLNKKKYKAFGTGVPDGISFLLRIDPLNFHRQHAGPFWFRETAGEVSRQLNSIVNLDLIDTTLSNLSSQQRKAKTQKEVIQQRIKEAKAEKRKLRYILSFDKDLLMLEKIGKRHKENADRLIKLVDLLYFAKQHQIEINRPIPKVGCLMELCKEYKKLNRKREQLSELFSRAEEFEEIDCQLGIEIKEAEKELKKLVGKTCPWCGGKLK